MAFRSHPTSQSLEAGRANRHALSEKVFPSQALAGAIEMNRKLPELSGGIPQRAGSPLKAEPMTPAGDERLPGNPQALRYAESLANALQAFQGNTESKRPRDRMEEGS